MKRKTWFCEFGPGYGDNMQGFVATHVARAVGVYGLQVRGPYKVQHHRGGWIKVFEFTGPTRRDMARFLQDVYELGEPPFHWPRSR